MKTQAKEMFRGRFFVFGTLAILLGIMVAYIVDSNNTDNIYRLLHNRRPINKIELKISIGGDSGFDRTILDTMALRKFGTALQGGEKITFDAPRMHSISIRMDIYKDQKIYLFILKSMQSGWVIAAGKDWYRNDSLIQLLTPYLSSNAH